MGRHHVRIDGEWHTSIAPWGDLTWSFDAYGCKEATWGAYFPRGQRHPAMHPGALVEVMAGTVVRWAGEFAEADWREGVFTAMGIAYGAERYEALDGSGNATATPSTAADQAQSRGWKILGRSNVPTTAYVAALDGSSTCGALFDTNTAELGQWWTVQADRILRFAAAPTEPVWHLRPGLFALGNTDDDYASAIAVRYLDSATSTYKTALRVDTAAAGKYGYREAPVDATVLGPISTTKANAIGDGILLKGQSRLGWTDAIEVTADDLVTPGGTVGDPSKVRSHDLVRAFVDYDDATLIGGTYMDLVIGSTTHADGGAVATIAPLGGKPQTLADVIEEMFNVAAGKAA